jgi:hypothetical protein
MYLAGFIAFMAVIFPAGGNLAGGKAEVKYWTNDGYIFGLFPLSMLSFSGSGVDGWLTGGCSYGACVPWDQAHDGGGESLGYGTCQV